MLFIDQPVGTGLSYTKKRNGFPTNDDEVNQHFISFLDAFFKLHSKYIIDTDQISAEVSVLKTRAVYFSGESHAGHYIPSIMAAILKRNSLVNEQLNKMLKKEKGLDNVLENVNIIIDAKGCALGNPWIDPYHQYDASEISHGLGLISLAQKYSLKDTEKICQENLRNGKLNTRVCFSLLDDIIDSSTVSGSRKVLIYDSRKYMMNSAGFPPGMQKHYNKTI